jgi:hypothetical protein
MYKYLGTACAVLLLPDIFWNRISGFFSKLRLYVADINYSRVAMLNNTKFKKVLTAFIVGCLIIKSILFFLFKQNSYYKFIKDEKSKEWLEKFISSPIFPFAQSWAMFAPGPSGQTAGMPCRRYILYHF